MLTKVISYFAGAALRRWILGAGLALLIGSATLMWHNHKNKLIDHGAQRCVQEINAATVADLNRALAREKASHNDLLKMYMRVARENADALDRLRQAGSRVAELKDQIKEQEETDETYKKWSDADLPNGVGERLRSLQDPDDTNTSN